MKKTGNKTKENTIQTPFYRRMLFRVGLIFFAVLNVSILIGSFHTYSLAMKDEKEEALSDADFIIEAAKYNIREDTLKWMFNYWEAHWDEMDFLTETETKDRKASEEWNSTHENASLIYLKGMDLVTPEDLDNMSAEDQLHMAEYIYDDIWSYCDQFVLQGIGENAQYRVYKYLGDDRAFIYAGNVQEKGEAEASLGMIEKISLDNHPVVKEILENGEAIENVERFRSNDGSIDFLYAARPLELEGELFCVVGVAYPWADTRKDLMDMIYQVGGRTFLYMLFADLLLLFLLNLLVLDPVKRMQQNIRDYTKEKKSADVAQGLVRFNKRQDELGSLSRDITDLTKEMDRYVQDISALAEKNAAVGAELSVATKIQADMLPCTFPAFPDREEFDIFASMTPAKEVGGDFYDFFLLDDDHLAIVMADVSEKGVPSALFMVISRTLIKDQAQMCRSPKTILDEVNNKLYENNAEGMFVTVWLGILEISTGKINAVNAGHEYPAIRKPGGVFELMKDIHGFVLGAMPDMTYKEYEMQLEKGGCLFLYTDGVPEATNADSELFGTDRMIEALNKDPSASSKELLANVNDAVDEFVGEAPQFDDLTMLAITLR